jgi:hypothetical protein
MLKDNTDPTKAGELNEADLESVAGGLVSIASRKLPVPEDGRTITGAPIPDDGRSLTGEPVPNDGKS